MSEDINEGVQLLLARMESHPEEFGEYGRWHETLTAYERLEILYENETALLKTKLQATRRRNITARVIAELFEERDVKGVDVLASNQPISGMGYSGHGTAIGQYSTQSLQSISNQYTQSAQVTQQQLSAQHNTTGLLGNLFNKFKSAP